MKYVFVSDFGVFGGVETVLEIYLRELAQTESIDLISTSPIPKNIQEVCTAFHIPMHTLAMDKPRGIVNRILYSVRRRCMKRRVVRLCRQSDIVIDFKQGCARGIIKWAKNKGLPPLVLWIHGGMPFVEEWMQFDWSVYDKIVVLTDALKQKIAREYPQYRERLVRIYNPTESNHIRVLAQEPIDIDGSYFVHVSRLDRDKDLPTMIDAYDKFYQRTHAKTKLYIVGSGLVEDELKRYAATKSAHQQIIFTGLKRNPFPYMKGAKAVILSSPSEGLPCVLCEALACSDGGGGVRMRVF